MTDVDLRSGVEPAQPRAPTTTPLCVSCEGAPETSLASMPIGQGRAMNFPGTLPPALPRRDDGSNRFAGCTRGYAGGDGDVCT
jgi:hypothetical protein